MDDRVHLDAAFLLACLEMLENSIGRQGDGRGINDAKLFHPIFRAIASTVQKNHYFYSWLLIDCLATPI